MTTREEFNQKVDALLVNYEPDLEMKTYSFRSEYVPDAVVFLNRVLEYIRGSNLSFTSLFIQTDPRVQESLVQFQSKISLKELHDILRDIEDSHVMLQTLRQLPLSQNNCERDINLGCDENILSVENKPYKSLAQRDEEYQQSLASQKSSLAAQRKFGFSVTVFDENPKTIIVGLGDEWGQSLPPDEVNQALLEKVKTHIFNLYEGSGLNNATLIRIREEINNFMLKSDSSRYTGRVCLRRGKRDGDTNVYRYIA